MFTSLSLLYFRDITLFFHNIVFLRRKTSILYVRCMQLMLYIRCIFILPPPLLAYSQKKTSRGIPLLVSCLTSFRINGHQHHQDLVLHIRGHLISHLMLLHKYQHQDVLLVLLLPLLELQRYTLI
jgi:hypothetical protein